MSRFSLWRTFRSLLIVASETENRRDSSATERYPSALRREVRPVLLVSIAASEDLTNATLEDYFD